MFIDEALITIKSGDGGDGVIHFRHEKYMPRGGPDGGDGGRGGDVVLQVAPGVNTLAAFRHQTKYAADNGKNGARSNRSGRSAQELVIPVPAGTIVFNQQSGAILGDLTENNQRLVVATGGRGGRGNQHYASSSNQAPRYAERGEPGQELELRLELKLIADIGIVGVPNAGKSTFLAAVTNAKPKIAPYPFTTLEPNLGVASLDEDNNLVLADIPGLIEGAHLGIGLGHDFLRHIQRTRVLIHLLDGMSEDPVADYAQINTELALFDPHLAEKPQVVAMNKADLPEVQERWPKVAAELKRHGLKSEHGLLLVSAVTGENVRKLLYQAAQRLAETPTMAEISAEVMPVYRVENDPNTFRVESTPDGYRVHGEAIERAAAMTYWGVEASQRRFQRILVALGIDAALRKAGVQDGDMVAIGEYELEWVD